MPGAFDYVHWIGGGSGAGKTTVARRLARERGWRVCDSDAVMGCHARRLSPGEAPFLPELSAMDTDRRRPCWRPSTGSGVSDSASSSRIWSRWGRPPVVAEGFRLLPRLVAGPASAGKAVWLLPTPAFRRAAVRARQGTGRGFLGAAGDSERAARNLSERDRMLTDRIRVEADRLGLPAVRWTSAWARARRMRPPRSSASDQAGEQGTVSGRA